MMYSKRRAASARGCKAVSTSLVIELADKRDQCITTKTVRFNERAL